MIDKLKTESLSWILWALYRLLSLTWRYTRDPLPPEIEQSIRAGKPFMLAHFHEDEWCLIADYARIHPYVLVSQSKDGSIMARFLERLGYHVARGSSSRGAVAGFLALLRLVKGSANPKKMVSIAVDGPRGPRHKSKFGIFKMAEVLDAEILTGATAADRAWVFRRSWSNAYIPKPFARVHLSLKVEVPLEEVRKHVERDDLAELGYKLEKSILHAKSLAQMSLSSPAATKLE
jgi:lysophospholipid acyltransferase (LPLAT)-like uncharacterized protein